MSVYSGIPILKLGAELMIRDLNLPTTVHLILDVPPGYALSILASVPSPAVIVTAASSTHYLRDLLDLQPKGLIASPVGPEEIRQALGRVATGENLYFGPLLADDPLTPGERVVFRLIACGLEDAEIALKLGVSGKTVANRVSSIMDKLSLKNRVTAALVYFGIIYRIDGLLEKSQENSGKNSGE